MCDLEAVQDCTTSELHGHTRQTPVYLSSLLTHQLLASVLKLASVLTPHTFISQAVCTSACFPHGYQTALWEIKMYFSIRLRSKCFLHYSTASQRVVRLHQTPLRCLLRTHSLRPTIKSGICRGMARESAYQQTPQVILSQSEPSKV